MQITDELRVIVEAEVEKAIANMRKLDESVDNTEKHTKSLSEAIDSISGKAMILSAAVGGAGIAAIKFAGDIENTKTSLEVLLKDGDAASKMFREWQGLAAETPFSSTDIDSAGKKLLAFNIEASKVTDTLRRIGDISAATGSSISDIADIYGKARVQGRLFAEDINQFQGRGIPVVQALADVLGTTEANVKKMVEKGKVGFPELEKAFENLTGPGGQFEGMMERLSTKTLGKFSTAMDNGRMAVASFGEIMLPTANDVLDAATEIFQGFTDLDDGTKRFIITMGGVVAVSGPAILAIKGINVALAAMAANPMILGIAGAVAGIALIAAQVNRQAHAYEDLTNQIKKQDAEAKSLIESYSKGNDAKKLDKDTTDRLIKLYPELTGLLKSYGVEAGAAAKAVDLLSQKKMKEANNKELERLRAHAEAIEEYKQQYADAQKELDEYYARVEAGSQKPQGGEVVRYKKNIRETKQYISDLQGIYDEYFTTLSGNLNALGYKLTDDLHIIKIPIEIDLPTPDANGNKSGDIKKRWQEWFEEITKVSEKKFGQSGERAGSLYVEGLDLSTERAKKLATALGEDFNISEALKAQQDEIKKTLSNLLSIDPKDIDSSFSVTDTSIQVIIDKFRELSGEITGLDYSDTLNDLSIKISDIGKSEDELAMAAYKAKGFSDEQARSLVSLNNQLSKTEILAEYTKRIDEMGKSEKELALSKFALLGATEEEISQFAEMFDILNSGGEKNFQEYFTSGVQDMLDQWGVLDEQTNKTLANMAYQLANMSFDAVLSGISDVGKAFAQGADAGEALEQALGNMALQIVDQLPLMFLQAGLQLIASGNWPMGLAFIAAAGSSAFISGYVHGKTDESEDDTSTKNAKGGAYDTAGLMAFAKGGAFTNSIVDRPTLFKFANGTGLMGEAGAEAIIPLKRGSDGRLGISAFGDTGSTSVLVNIINNTSEPVEHRESTSADGSKLIEVTIGQLISKKLSDGSADRVLRSRYGIKPVGVG